MHVPMGSLTCPARCRCALTLSRVVDSWNDHFVGSVRQQRLQGHTAAFPRSHDLQQSGKKSSAFGQVSHHNSYSHPGVTLRVSSSVSEQTCSGHHPHFVQAMVKVNRGIVAIHCHLISCVHGKSISLCKYPNIPFPLQMGQKILITQ